MTTHQAAMIRLVKSHVESLEGLANQVMGGVFLTEAEKQVAGHSLLAVMETAMLLFDAIMSDSPRKWPKNRVEDALKKLWYVLLPVFSKPRMATFLAAYRERTNCHLN